VANGLAFGAPSALESIMTKELSTTTGGAGGAGDGDDEEEEVAEEEVEEIIKDSEVSEVILQ
jgi:hypothetical protein